MVTIGITAGKKKKTPPPPPPAGQLKLLRNGWRNTTKSLKVLTRPASSPDPNLIEHLSDGEDHPPSPPRHTGPKQSTTKGPVTDTTGQPQKSNDHVFTGQSSLAAEISIHEY